MSPGRDETRVCGYIYIYYIYTYIYIYIYLQHIQAQNLQYNNFQKDGLIS